MHLPVVSSLRHHITMQPTAHAKTCTRARENLNLYFSLLVLELLIKIRKVR